MRYFLVGILAGIILALSPIFMERPAPSVYPEWSADLTSTAKTAQSTDTLLPVETRLTEMLGESIFIFTSGGSLADKIDLPPDTLAALSESGKFYASYKKVAEEISFASVTGERFWKINSMEYPYLSPNGKVILLLVADLSNVRIVGYNGNPLGIKEIPGMMCTAISFAHKTDSAAVGFLDGSITVVSENGELRYRGRVPSGVVKTIALSDSAHFLAVHYGNAEKDGLFVVDMDSKKEHAFSLPSHHFVKTGLHVNDNGDVAIVNNNAFILCTKKGSITARIPLAPQRPGQSAVISDGSMYAFSYRKEEGGSALYLCTDEGTTILKKDFPMETHLDCAIRDGILTARGLASVYAWRIEK
jgi:hypothetical protein